MRSTLSASGRRRFLTAAFVMTLAAPCGAAAQPAFETLHEFVESQNSPFGHVLEASDGRLYGVVSRGGAFSGGSIFVIDRGPDGTHTVSTFHDFRQSEGWHPFSGLIEGADGNLYGTTTAGGALGGGTVYRISLQGQLTVIHALDPATDGHSPTGALVLGSDGRLYGTTQSGGPGGQGTVFRVGPTGGFARLHAFSGPDGTGPAGTLIQASDGHFYGTTPDGGTFGVGTVFRISSGGQFLSLYHFSEGIFRPNTPVAGLAELSPGIFCGTQSRGWGPTLWDGDYSTGGVFCITAAGEFTQIYEFIGSIFAGSRSPRPWSPLFARSDGFIYLAATSDSGLRLYRFTGTKPELVGGLDGVYGTGGGLTETSDGRLYGVASSSGTIFMEDGSGSVQAVHTFSIADGYLPTGRLLRSLGGTLYATTFSGGTYDEGTIFTFAPTTGLETIASAGFGAGVVGDLTETATSALFFTAGNAVFVFKSDTQEFQAVPCTNELIVGPLTLASDGYLYGRKPDRPTDAGALRRITTAGCPLETLHTFSGADGAEPYGGVLQASDGNFYGTTSAGGTFGLGTIFKMTAGGSLTTLHHFAGKDGDSPAGPLIQGRDGNLYGTTLLGGEHSAGTVFTISQDGVFASLHHFQPAEGGYILAGLLQTSDGAFYGAAAAGGLGTGTIFRITEAGVFSVVHQFGPGEGAHPIAGLTEGGDGHLYGMTPLGGKANVGTIYRIRIAEP